MDVLVKKFTVRFEGKRYGAEQIIKNMPDDVARELEANSSGNVILLSNSAEAESCTTNREVYNSDDKNEDANDKIDEGFDKNEDDDSDAEEIKLPDANLDQTVKRGRKPNA